MANQNDVAITVVVNGKPTPLSANLHAPLKTVIPRALELSGNVGQPPDNWELRDANGQLLDQDRKVADLGISAGATIFLNLKAGVGG